MGRKQGIFEDVVQISLGCIEHRGTWCSGITSASHAEGPGFKPQCVHFLSVHAQGKRVACLQVYFPNENSTNKLAPNQQRHALLPCAAKWEPMA